MMERFGVPGKTMLGSDSHTPAAGSLGMLAIGAGGLEMALAMTGKPFYLKTPKIWGVKLSGDLPAWVSAKDVILEMLRRHDVDGGVGKVIEYYGPGLKNLTAMDRHVIANMGAELGATSTVFPADEAVKTFLKTQGRADAWRELIADEIMPAGARVLPFRSNIPGISRFVFNQIDESYYDRAMPYQDSGSFIVGGYNYGQGSSREHAALAPRYLA